jgi:ribonuclease HII
MNKLYDFDKEYNRLIIGVDEAGRGPLAGPVVAAAVVINKYSQYLEEVNDSKKLTEAKREKIYENILNDENIIFGVGIVNSDIIDEINILQATYMAMRKAIDDIVIINKEDYLILVDGNREIKDCNYMQETVVKGDAKSLSIATASIIAKVTRDRIMKEFDNTIPGYNFSKHKGYGTKEHYKLLRENGISNIHRKTFLKNF